MHRHNRVMNPNLAQGGRYLPSGLSFTFISEQQLPLGSYVTASKIDCTIIGIGIEKGGMGHKDLYVYSCKATYLRAHELASFHLMMFNKKPVTAVTNEAKIAAIQRAATLC